MHQLIASKEKLKKEELIALVLWTADLIISILTITITYEIIYLEFTRFCPADLIVYTVHCTAFSGS